MFGSRTAARALVLVLAGATLQLPLTVASAERTPGAMGASASAGATSGATRRTVRGIYRVVSADIDGRDGKTRDVLRKVLELPNGRWLDLQVPDTVRPSYNSAVELIGVGDDQRLDVQQARQLTGADAETAQPKAALDGSGGTTAAAAGTQPTSGTTTVLVILAHWTQPDAVTPAKAAEVVFTQGNPWWKEASYGALAITGRVTPWFKITAPTNGCYSDADLIMSRAKTAASAYNPGSYQRTIVYFPACGGPPGWAFVGEGGVWLNGTLDQRISIHEQGHNYGLGHAHSYRCGTASAPTTLIAPCQSDEYGDPFDAMGGGSYVGHFSGRHKDLLGWLGARKVPLPSNELVRLTPLETANGIKAGIVTVSSTRSYWVEQRAAVGVDKNFPAVATGVQVRLVSSAVDDGGPQLLDQRPGDGIDLYGSAGGDKDYYDEDSVSLPAQSSWTTPEGIRISVGAVTSSGAEVTALAHAPDPTPPAQPTDVLASAGDTRATVTWSRPATDNGSVITSYVVTAQPGAKAVTVPTVGGTVRTASFTGLLNDTAYTFTVVAKNAKGASLASTASQPVTPTLAVPAVAITSPATGATVTTETLPVTVTTTPNARSGAAVNYVRYEVDGSSAGGSTVAPFSTTLDLSPFAPGPHKLQAFASDTNNREGASPLVDLTYAPPTASVSITSPVTGAELGASSVRVVMSAVPSSEAHPLQSVYATHSNGEYAGSATRVDGTNTWAFDWDVSGLEVGRSYMLVGHATDDRQRTATSAPVSVSFRHTVLDVAITSPGSDATVAGSGAVGFTVTKKLAGDPEAASAQVVADAVTLLGTLAAGASGADPSGAWTIPVDWRSLGNGPHTITVTAVNTDGFGATTDPRSIVVANPLPTGTVTSPASGATVVGLVQVQGSATPDPGTQSPVNSGSLMVDGTVVGPLTADGLGGWTGEWDSRPAIQGGHVLSLSFVDADGYRGSSDGVTVFVDNPGPSVAVTSPVQDQVIAGSVSLTASTTAAADPVATVEYVLDGATVAVANASSGVSWAASFDASGLLAGSHQLTARATDTAGTFRDSEPVQVSVITRPDPPDYVDAYLVGGAVELSWYPPYYDGGTPVTGYRIEVVDQAGLVLQTIDVGDVTTYTLPVLTGDAAFVQVRSIGPAGSSASANGPYYVDLAPAPVTGVVATGGDRALTVRWTPSVSQDVSTVDVYVAAGTATPDVEGFPDYTAGPTGTSATITGLTSGVTYTVAVVVRDNGYNSSTVTSRTLLGTAIATAVSPSTVVYGAAVNVTATLVRAGTTTRLPGRVLTLFQRKRGTAAWVLVGRVSTGSTGVATSRRVPTVNTEYLWTLTGASADMGSSGPVRAALVRAKVGIALSATQVALGRTVTLSGTVAPNHRGQRVYLQQKVGTGWRNITSALLSSTSTVRFTVTGRTRGTQYYRLYKPADADHTAGYSAIRSLAVV